MTDPLETMSPEELIEQSDLVDIATGLFVEDCYCAECKEVMRRLRGYDAMTKEAIRLNHGENKAGDKILAAGKGEVKWKYGNRIFDILSNVKVPSEPQREGEKSLEN